MQSVHATLHYAAGLNLLPADCTIIEPHTSDVSAEHYLT